MMLDSKGKFFSFLFIIIFSFFLVSVGDNSMKDTVVFGQGKMFRVSKYFSVMDEKNIDKVQKALDRGNAIVVYNKLDNYDDKLSYIAGHNPGVLGKFAKFAKKDREVCIYDSNGNSRYYVLKFLAKQDKNKREACDEINNLVNNRDKAGECVVFQFCVGKNIQFWLGSPKDVEEKKVETSCR